MDTKAHTSIRLLFTLIAVAAIGCLAQEMTLTTSTANTVASKATIDVAGLINNPFAIIVATPAGNTVILNPHPIGAWYYNGKWNIHNTDNATLALGLTFKVQVFLNRDANHFLHVVSLDDLHSFIDHPALNNNPNAQVAILQNHAPDSRPYNLNPNETSVLYDNLSGRWYIKNKNNAFLKVNTAYNVVIGPGGPIASNPTVPVPLGTAPIAAVPVRTGPTAAIDAGGDLRGPYPSPNVVGLNGRPLSSAVPEIGDTLRWNGTVWESYTAPVNGPVTTGTSSMANSAMQAFYKQPPDGSPRFHFTNTTPATRITILSHTIVLTKESRVVISASSRFFGSSCPVGCSDGEGSFYVRVNGTGNARHAMDFSIAHDKTIGISINSYVRDLGPGTHTIDFWIEHRAGTSAFEASPMNSSVLVFPL